jgi:hypothetical protein
MKFKVGLVLRLSSRSFQCDLRLCTWRDMSAKCIRGVREKGWLIGLFSRRAAGTSCVDRLYGKNATGLNENESSDHF